LRGSREKAGPGGDHLKRILGIALVLFLLGLEQPGWQVELYPQPADGRVRLAQGEALLVRVKSEAGGIQEAGGEVFGSSLPLVRTEDGWLGLFGVDMDQEPGKYSLVLRLKLADGREEEKRVRLLVQARDYGTDRLTLPREKVELSAEALARVQTDQQALARAWQTPSSMRYWSGPFQRPAPGEVNGVFGRRRIINGQPRSPHTGQDLRAGLGDPVLASNAGQVVLVRDCFFSGNSVLVDHGLGLYSMYFHLSEVKVKEGEMVEKGQILGLVGMSGRATGPHLHWGFRLLGARVDPEAILALPLP